MDRLQKSLGSSLDHFTAHDLRRTVATELSRLKIDRVVIAKIRGHRWADREVTAVYDRWDKLPEMREALRRRWSSKLEQIATGEPAKVVKMR